MLSIFYKNQSYTLLQNYIPNKLKHKQFHISDQNTGHMQ